MRTLLALALLTTPALAQHQFFPMPGSSPSTFPELRAMSGDGRVLVGILGGPQDLDGWRWEYGCDSEIVVNGIFAFLAASGVVAANEDGSLLAGSRSTGSEENDAILWSQSGGIVSLGNIPGGSNPVANDMTPSGDRVVGTIETLGGQEAFLWQPGTGMVGLGTVPGSTSLSSARCISADGSVVGGGGPTGAGNEAFLWEATQGWTPLGDLPGGPVISVVVALSSDGSVAACIGTPAQFILEAARWTPATGMVGLGFLPGDTTSIASDMSVDGNVIVGFSLRASTQRAFLWTSALGMVDLRDHLLANGASGLGGWELLQALTVSSDGSRLAGLGRVGGQFRLWTAVLGPTPSLAPMGTTYCAPSVPNSTGSSASMTSIGSPVVTDDDARLIARDLPADTFVLFACSQTQGFVANPGGSQGDLCLGGAIGRFAGIRGYSVATASTSGCATLDFSPGQVPTPQGLVAALPGETWNFQAWYRDANPNPTSNFTDGLSLTFQ